MKLTCLNTEAAAGMLIRGTHFLTYSGLDGERYRVSWCRESGVSFLDLQRVDGSRFRISGRTVRRYRPIMNQRELGALLHNTAADHLSAAELEPVQ
jgi:hypothetical protein